MDLNGFPPAPPLAAAAGTTDQATVADGRPLVFNQMCVACHAVGGRGGSVGPALDGIAGRFDRDYFTQWLTDPTAIRPETTMPKLPLTEAQIGDLSDYLASLEN
jgi:nitric oxide reductase subunit C